MINLLPTLLPLWCFLNEHSHSSFAFAIAYILMLHLITIDLKKGEKNLLFKVI